MSSLRIGISGWTYPRWRGVFYPRGLLQRKELAFASRMFDSIEINGSFYSLQSPPAFRAWYDQTPPGFLFSIKGSRFITHMKKLKDPRVPLANFFASGPLELREKMGPILWQFPPQMKFNENRLREFFLLLPKKVSEAVALAEEHNPKIIGDSETKTSKSRIAATTAPRTPLRYAVEVRHDSFASEAFIDLLTEFGIAFVIADAAGQWTFPEVATSDFVYARLHGDKELYASGYDETALNAWARRIRHWRREGKDVYVYFDNDAKVRAPFDALALAERLHHGSSVRPSLPGHLRTRNGFE